MPLPPHPPPQVAYLYTKVRAEFGKDCKFVDADPTVLESIVPTEEFDDKYTLKQPSISEVSSL